MTSPSHPRHSNRRVRLFREFSRGHVTSGTWRSRGRPQPPPCRSAGPAAARTGLHPGERTRSPSAEVEGRRPGTTERSRGSRGSGGNKDKHQFSPPSEQTTTMYLEISGFISPFINTGAEPAPVCPLQARCGITPHVFTSPTSRGRQSSNSSLMLMLH